MTQPERDSPNQETRGRNLMMRGAMVAMAACFFAGLTAVVLAVLGQRLAAAGVAGVGGLGIVAGVWMQARGWSLIRKAKG